jgi:hypothetical protein
MKVTIAMSALFDTRIGVFDRSTDVPRLLELRNNPIVRRTRIYSPQSTWQYNYTPTIDSVRIFGQKGFSDLVQDALFDLDTDWMYTAILQGALGGPAPAWSKDEWSFVPLSSDMETSSLAKFANSGSDRSSNLTLETAAIRARLECSTLDWPGTRSTWLNWAESNDTRDSTIHVPGGLNYIYWPKLFVSEGEESTRMTAQRNVIQCCGNITNNTEQTEQFAPSVLAYWTENWGASKTDWEPILGLSDTNGNFTVKWIRGPAGVGSISGRFKETDQLYYPEPPAIQALNCVPYFETSTARVTTEIFSGTVQDYHILETPTQERVAWSDAYKWRNISEGTQFSDSYDETWENMETRTKYIYDVKTTTR